MFSLQEQKACEAVLAILVLHQTATTNLHKLYRNLPPSLSPSLCALMHAIDKLKVQEDKVVRLTLEISRLQAKVWDTHFLFLFSHLLFPPPFSFHTVESGPAETGHCQVS